MEGFRYRVHDVWSQVTPYKADLFTELDFKKKMLKSPDLKTHFQENPKEREILIKGINTLRTKMDQNKAVIS